MSHFVAEPPDHVSHDPPLYNQEVSSEEDSEVMKGLPPVFMLAPYLGFFTY